LDPGIRELFTFTSGEKKGLLVLTGIIILLLLIYLLLPVIVKDNSTDQSEWMQRMSQIDIKATDTIFAQADSDKTEDEVSPVRELFEFDPNTAEKATFRELGLLNWQIKIIDKYRKKGGVFRNAEDFGKIYGIGKIQYETLSPFIHIKSTTKDLGIDSNLTIPFNKKRTYLNDTFLIEINSCDSTELGKIHGIGKSTAVRIVKYRARMGGFARLDQLLEVYGISFENYSKLVSRLKIDTTRIRKLNLNSIDYYELKSHPYLTPFQAKSILKYRELRGHLGAGDLMKNNLLSKEELAKIRPYLSFE
jgi:competence protein ComEA